MAAAWSEAAIPDLTGVTAVVAGVSGGIGLQVARGLAGKGAHMVLGVRPADRGQCAAAAIRHACSGAQVEVMGLDLADLAGFELDFGTNDLGNFALTGSCCPWRALRNMRRPKPAKLALCPSGRGQGPS